MARPIGMTRKDFPLVDLAVDHLTKAAQKAVTINHALSFPTEPAKSLITQAEEIKRIAKKAQGENGGAAKLEWELSAHLSAALKVGCHLHLTKLVSIKRAQEKAGVTVTGDTRKMINAVEALASRLSDQMLLIGPGGVNQAKFEVLPWVEPVVDNEEKE